MAYDLTPVNPYFDEEYRKKARGRFMESLQPQTTEGINQVMAGISPYEPGRRGASLLRNVYNPATQALAGFEAGQEEKGAALAANLPFQIAGLTGKLGTEATLAGRGQTLSEELGRGQLGLGQEGQEFQKKVYEEQKPFQEAALTGYYKDAPTTQMISQLLPYITQGYLPTTGLSGILGQIQPEQAISPEYQLANKLGINNPFVLSLLSEIDPDAMKRLLQKNYNV